MSIDGRPQAPLLSNPRADRVKEVARLAGRSSRLKTGTFLAEGPQAVREALSAHRQALDAGGPAVVAQVYATEACLERLPELADLSLSAPLRLATDEVLAAMADTVNPQGIVAVCHIPSPRLADVLDAGPRLIAVLCEVRDPGNAGTILRAADSAGADAVVLTRSSVDIYNPKAVRSTAGSLFHLPVITGQDFEELADTLRTRGITILAADGYGSADLDVLQDEAALRRLLPAGSETVLRPAGSEKAGNTPDEAPAAAASGVPVPADEPPAAAPRLEEPSAWLFGNEAQGLSDAELAAADHRVAVPVYGQAESLNVGTAATVCLYASARALRR